MAKALFILPVYNEEEAVYSVIADICQAPLPPGYGRQVLAIDDGSTDNSSAELERAARHFPVHIVSYAPNRGIPHVFAEALQYIGSNCSDDDLICILESDGTSDVAIIPDLVAAIESGVDVAIGSRHIRGGSYVRFPRHRILGSSAVNYVLRVFWRIPHVTDYTIFYRAYRGSVLRGYALEALPFKSRKSFAVNGEMLLRLSHMTDRFAEVPLRYDYGRKKGKSKMRLVQTLVEYAYLTPRSLIASFFQVGAVGAIGAVLQAAILIVLVEQGDIHPVIANTLAAEAAIVSNFTLNNLWTFRGHERGPLIPSFLLFNLSALSSITIQAVAMWIGLHQFGDRWYVLYAVIGIGFGWLTNFFLYHALIWKRRRPATFDS